MLIYKQLIYKKIVLGSKKRLESSVLSFSNLKKYTLVSNKKLVYKKKYSAPQKVLKDITLNSLERKERIEILRCLTSETRHSMLNFVGKSTYRELQCI